PPATDTPPPPPCPSTPPFRSTAAASGNPNPTVQWEVSTDHGVTYTPIAGATADTLTFTTAVAQNGNRYEAVFTNAIGSATTTAARLNVQFAPTIASNPSSDTVTTGQPVTFTAAADGKPNARGQWEDSTDNGATYTPSAGAPADALTFTAAANQNGNLYEAVFTNAIGSATTTAAHLNVQFAPTIASNPSSDTVTTGQAVTFTAAASG